MKIIRTKTFWIIAIFIGVFFFAEKVAIIISDSTQQEICANETCITKPKGWLPIIVKRDEGKFFLNVVNISKMMSFMEDEEDHLSPLSFDDNKTQENHSSGILLYKDSKYIFIQRFKFTPNTKTEQYYEKFVYMSKTYYVKKSKYIGSAIVLYPKNELYITMPSLDKDLLNEISSF